MEGLYEKSMSNGIPQSLIDMLAFYSGNYVAHKTSGTFPKPNIEKTIVWGASDLLIRQGFITFWMNKLPFSGTVNRNAYIGFISFLGDTLIDIIKGKDLATGMKNNLLLNGMGIFTNTIVDYVIPERYV